MTLANLKLPAQARRDWIAQRLDPLDSAPDARAAPTWLDVNPDVTPPEGPLVLAAVLMALVERPEGLTLLLTLRPETMRSHAGQIALPGGRSDPGEASWQTALREAEEEIGLPRDKVTLAGLATPYITGANFLIVPVVGFTPPDVALTANPAEVAEIFETPLEFLMDPVNHERRQMLTDTGETRHFHAITWEDRYIWGATAAILNLFHQRLFGPAP